MGKQRIKPNYRRRVLRLPDLDHWIIANWLCSIASARQPRAAFTSTPSINSFLGIAVWNQRELELSAIRSRFDDGLRMVI
jgi:hypothetical protein